MRRLLPLASAVAIVVAACSGAPSVAPTTEAVPVPPTVAPATTSPAADVIVDPTAEPTGVLAQATEPWPTDWTRRTIELDELLLGIRAVDPRDRIQPLDEPVFGDTAEAATWLTPDQPGVVVDVDGDARFYPLTILTRHEIVNDQVGGLPVSVTYCPLCNTAVVFDRRLGDETLRLGVSGLLRLSDMVMWDDATTSLWQQVDGSGLVGTHAGRRLTILPSRVLGLGAFAEAYPDGQVLSQNQLPGYRYLVNPYEGYSSRSAPYGYFTDEPDPRRPALERVVGVEVGAVVAGYPFGDLAEVRVVNDELGGTPIVVMWAEGVADNLDATDPTSSADAGAGVAYVARAAGQDLTFAADAPGTFVDAETGSTWTIDGHAVDGPLEGERLEVAIHRNEFFFAWAAFFPDARLWEA